MPDIMKQFFNVFIFWFFSPSLVHQIIKKHQKKNAGGGVQHWKVNLKERKQFGNEKSGKEFLKQYTTKFYRTKRHFSVPRHFPLRANKTK